MEEEVAEMFKNDRSSNSLLAGDTGVFGRARYPPLLFLSSYFHSTHSSFTLIMNSLGPVTADLLIDLVETSDLPEDPGAKDLSPEERLKHEETTRLLGLSRAVGLCLIFSQNSFCSNSLLIPSARLDSEYGPTTRNATCFAV